MDLERIFLGDVNWSVVLEILLRTTIMYFYTLLMIRLLGKRGLSQLSPFELLIIVALGSAVGDPMFYPEVPLVSGILVITTVVVLETFTVRITEKNRAIEKFIESEPVLLVADGAILQETLDNENLSIAEIQMRLRLEGVEHLGDVRRAYLEPSGQVSIFWTTSDREGKGQSILPEQSGSA